MTQVHKEQLTQVDNAIAGRQSLDIEIFGMEGVPQDVIDQHNAQVTTQHFREEKERQAATGNPARGALNGLPNKRAKKNETIEEIEANAAKFRTDRANGVLPQPAAEVVVESVSAIAWTTHDIAADMLSPQKSPAVQAFPPPGNFPPGQFPPGYSAPPGGIPGASGLPQRPGFDAPPPGAFPNGGPGADFSASLDDLIADAQKAPATGEAPAEKKAKKDKNINLVFSDDFISPEEKMAALPRFVEFMRT